MREQRNPHLAIEALRRLVEQEMRTVTKHNIVKQKSFAERLEDLMRKYTNQNLTAAQIIAELVALAKEVSADANRGATFAPPLNIDELAFYNAVTQNESAVTGMGTTVLADIARDLVRTLRRDVTTDWVARDDVRAKIRSTIKRLLAKYGSPPRRRGRRDQARPRPDGNLRRRLVPRSLTGSIIANPAVRFTEREKSIQLPFSHGNLTSATMAWQFYRRARPFVRLNGLKGVRRRRRAGRP